MDHVPRSMPEWHGVDARMLAQVIFPRNRPAILRGFVRHWPAVQHGLRSPESVCRYLMSFDNGNPVDALMLPPEAGGRLFYSDDMQGFNYLRNRVPVSAVISQLARYSRFPVSPAVAVQSALIADCLPGFSAENALLALDVSVLPRIWLGNRIITPAHFDQSDNIACVVAGRRRFTLFPPDQVANLYIGPLDHAPTPTPISLVDFKAPDLDRFPRFRDALAAAEIADLAPGDAIYIPTLWWHHVESLDALNILVNYWWGGAAKPAGTTASAFESLLNYLRERPEPQDAYQK